MPPALAGDSPKPYGKRLVPNVIDEVAQSDPDRTCYILPASNDTYAQGSRVLSYSVVANAINKAAWFLEDQLGRSKTHETVAYIGPNDLRYFLLLIAAIKVGYTLLLPSPRNSANAHVHLLTVTECKTILKGAVTKVDHITAESSAAPRVLDVPELDELLTAHDSKPYPYGLSYEEAQYHPVVVLHTSGSTGQVNPIVQTHRSWATVDRHHLLASHEGLQPALTSLPHGGSILLAMPYFHAAGVMSGILLNVFFDGPGILVPPGAPLSTPTIIEAMEHCRPKVAVLAPSTLEEMVLDSKALELLGHLDQVHFGGGALAPHAAELVAKRTQLQSIMGSTEAAILPTYVLEDGIHEYEYLRVNPSQTGIQFQEIDTGVFELVLVRDPGLEFTCVFETYPDLIEYRTKDVFEPHPKKLGLWKHMGRTDDVITLSNAEKVVPSILESHLQRVPIVKDVVIAGQGRFAVAAIIELTEAAQAMDRQTIQQQLEPAITTANSQVPSHARLSSDLIIIAPPQKPLVRVGKGTVSRKATIIAYEAELGELYGGDSGIAVRESEPLVKGVDEETVVTRLLELFSRVFDLFTELTPTRDFLSLGIDSLQVFTLVRHITAQLRAEGAAMPLQLVRPTLLYSNPTVQQLARALKTLEASGHAESIGPTTGARVENMQRLLSLHSADLAPRKAMPDDADKDEEPSVILTGSTGSLGSYLLYALLTKSPFQKVFCLNRAVDGKSKQLRSFEDRGLPTATCDDRVTFLQADLARPMLGLEEGIYRQMVASTSLILHVQWAVNFNLSLSTFEPHVQGVKNLVALAVEASLNPTLVFASSIAATQNWTMLDPKLPVPEHVVHDAVVAAGSGYGESKWVAENLLERAAQKCRITTRILRLGQLAGAIDTPSVWNTDEWFPSLILSSRHLGVLPQALSAIPVVDFVPVDRAAAILLEVGLRRSESDAQGHQLFNLLNPHHVMLASILSKIAATLKPSPKLVRYEEWFTALQAASETQPLDVEALPAVKLFDFFEHMGSAKNVDMTQSSDTGRYSTTKLQAQSSQMRALEAVDASWVAHWLSGWNMLP